MGKKQEDFGYLFGRSGTTITNWEAGRVTPPERFLKKIAESTGANEQWLRNGKGPMMSTSGRPAAKAPGEDSVKVEILTLAGLGDLYDLRNPESAEATRLDKNLIIDVGRETRTAIRCKGDSMSPTILNDALVGIDLNDRKPVDNGIFLLRFRDLGMAVKRLRFRIDGYLIVSDNPAVEDELVPGERFEEELILGRVRWIYNKV